MTPTPRALLALREAHNLLVAAILASPYPPGPLLHAAVEVADALEEIEDAERDTEKTRKEGSR